MNFDASSVKREIIKEEEGTVDETIEDSSQLRDDGEDFILPSQPSQRCEIELRWDVDVQNDSGKTLGSDRSQQKHTIDETIMADETTEEMYLKPTQDDFARKVPCSEDIFGTQTQTQLYEPQIDETLIEETPPVRAPFLIPETPASPRLDFSSFETIPETPRLPRFEQLTGSSHSFDRRGIVGPNVTSSGTASETADTQPVPASVIALDSDDETPQRRAKIKRRWDDVIDLESSSSILEDVSVVELAIPPTLPGKDMKDFVAGVLGEDSSSQDSGGSASPGKRTGSESPVKTTRIRSDGKVLAGHNDSSTLNVSVEEIVRETKSAVSDAPSKQRNQEDLGKPLVELSDENISSSKSPTKVKSPEKMDKMAATVHTNGSAIEGEKENFFSGTYDVRTKFPAIEVSGKPFETNRDEFKIVTLSDSPITEIGHDDITEGAKKQGQTTEEFNTAPRPDSPIPKRGSDKTEERVKSVDMGKGVEDFKTVPLSDSGLTEKGNDEKQEFKTVTTLSDSAVTEKDNEEIEEMEIDIKEEVAAGGAMEESVPLTAAAGNVRIAEQSGGQKTMETVDVATAVTCQAEESCGDDDGQQHVHQNTQPVPGLSDTEPAKDETGDEAKEGNCSLQERTLSLDNFHTAPDVTPDTEATEAVPSPKEEGGTPHLSDVIKIKWPILLEVSCSVEYCKATNSVLKKEITKVRPMTAHHGVLESWSESTDKSKRESLSSAGSVYSDKASLPFPLKPRVSLASVQTSSTSTNEDVPLVHPIPVASVSDVQPWKNDCLVPLACDEALDRHLALSISATAGHTLKKTPFSRLSHARKILFDKALLDSSGSFSREQSVEGPPIPVVKNDAKVENLPEASVVKDEKSDEITPLKKSTPKRNRRLLRGKVQDKTDKEPRTAAEPQKTEDAAGKDTTITSKTPKTRRRLPAKANKTSSVASTPVASTSKLALSDSLTSTSEATDTTIRSPRKTSKSSEKQEVLSETGQSVDAADKSLEESSAVVTVEGGSTRKYASKRRADEDNLDMTHKKLRRTEPQVTPVKEEALSSVDSQTTIKSRSDSVKKRGRRLASAPATPTSSFATQSDPDSESAKKKGRRRVGNELAPSSNISASSKPNSDSVKKSTTSSYSGKALPVTPSGSRNPPDSSSLAGNISSRRKVADLATPSTSADHGAESGKKRGRRRAGEVVTSAETAASSDFSSDSGRKLTRSITPGRTASSSLLAPGTAVFAIWTDRFSYSGVVEEEAGGKWTVVFGDGTSKQVTDRFILPLSALREGHMVQVLEDDGYSYALLTAIHRNKYLVEIEEQKKEVDVTDLRLTSEQFKLIKQDLAVVPGTPSTLSQTVDPDNIMSEKRRSGAGDHSTGEVLTAGSSKRKRKRSASPEATGPAFEFTPGLEMDETVLSNRAPKSKCAPGKTSKSRRDILKGTEDSSKTKEVGPIAEVPSDLFAGMSFLLCYVKPKESTLPKKSARKASSNSDFSMSESEDTHLYDKRPYDRFPFDESSLRQQLTAGGGTVYDRFSDVPSNKYKTTRLVTNRPNRSAKYLLCLVHNIDIILHVHVMEACRGGDFKSMKLHHVGFSRALNRWLDKPSKMNQTFKGKYVHLFSKSNDPEADSLFRSFWTLILKKTGASVTEDLNYADVVVTDSSLPQDIQESVEATGNTGPMLVSTNWAIESLMKGFPLYNKLHPSFNHYYDSESGKD